MAKKKVFLTMAIIFGVILAFSLAGCGDAGGGPTDGTPGSITYTGSKDGVTYTLEITENTNRAAYAPVNGDNFKLIEVISNKTMLGIIEISGGGAILTLIPNNGSDQITVTVSGSGIVSINGTNLLWDDGSTFTAPGTLEQGSGAEYYATISVGVEAYKGGHPILEEGSGKSLEISWTLNIQTSGRVWDFDDIPSSKFIYDDENRYIASDTTDEDSKAFFDTVKSWVNVTCDPYDLSAWPSVIKFHERAGYTFQDCFRLKFIYYQFSPSGDAPDLPNSVTATVDHSKLPAMKPYVRNDVNNNEVDDLDLGTSEWTWEL